MPYTVVDNDIREVKFSKKFSKNQKKNFLQFFPSTCKPVRIEILQNRRTNRPNGDGFLYFTSLGEVNEAMKYDRKYMGNRTLLDRIQ